MGVSCCKMGRFAKAALLLLCCLLTALPLFALAGCSDDGEENGQVILSYLEQEPESLDPQVAQDTSAKLVITNLFEGLTRLDASGQAQPGAAESWTASADNTSFTFHLRSDARWPVWEDDEGQEVDAPVTAADFVFGLRRALDPATNSPEAQTLYCIKNARQVNEGTLPVEELGVRAEGDYTLVIELEYAYEQFPTLMAQTVAMPCNEAFFRFTGGQYGLETNCVLGNGPFSIAAYGWEHEEYINLTVNSRYQGQQQVVPAGVEFTIGEAPQDTAGALASGQLDVASLPGVQLAKAQQEGLNLTSFEDTTWGLCFNTQTSPFNNRNVRLGLIQSLDRDYVLQALPDNCTPGEDIVLPQATLLGQSYRDQAGGGFYLKQDDNAKALLQQGLTEAGLDRLNLTVLCLDSSGFKQMATHMLEVWNRELGYYFNLEAVSLSELEQRIRSGDYEAVIAPLQAQQDGPLEVLSLFESSSSENPASLQDAAYDGLLAAASFSDGAQMLQAAVSAEQYLNTNGIFYPLCYEKRYFATAPNVTGVVFYPYDGGIDFRTATKTAA